MEEQLALSARELLSSAFTRRKSTETRSRSARNATLSFPSKMALFFKKTKSKVRIQGAVPSFFVSIGEDVRVHSPKEARKAAEERRPCAVVLVPDECVFSDVHGWAAALSSAAYLVVIGDPDEKYCRKLMKAIDGVVFSPVPRRLSSAFMVRTREEALSLIEGVSSAFPSVITIRSEAESGEMEDVR